MKADVDLNVNPNEVRDSRWVSQEDLKRNAEWTNEFGSEGS